MFCIVDPFSAENQQLNLKSIKLYSPGYNLLFNIIAIPSDAFFILMNEFVDACNIPQQVLIEGLPFRGFSLVCSHSSSLGLSTRQFAVDFVITFYETAPTDTAHILAWISLPKTFPNIKNWLTLYCSS